MYLLCLLGQMLEPALGKRRFGALYFTSLLTGSFGAILLVAPEQPPVGASGAVFGLMGAGVRHAARPRDQPDGSPASGR